MSTTALAIANASAQDLNIVSQGETLSAAVAQDLLRRLNNMVSGWRTHFSTVLAIERQVFALTANKQTYTIGLGGDFNVPRPVTINGAGLWLTALASAQTVTITRSGFVATVTLADHGLTVGQETLIAGANEIAYNGMQTVQSAPTTGTFTFTVEGAPATPATGTITSSAVSGTPVEIPRPILTDDGYQAIRIKNLANTLFTTVYYNPTYPFGTIFLWPLPNTATNQLVLYLQNVFSGFADLTTAYDWPDLPGYSEALQYQLDLRLATPYARTVPDDIRELARETFGLIKRANNKLSDLPNDATLALGQDPRGGYNINTGQ